MTHKEEISRTRLGGFGGSDAAMFYRIGKSGLCALTETDRKRIAVAKGIIPYIPIPETKAMEAGHLYEAIVSGNYELVETEKYMNNQSLVNNFKVFAHADIYHKLTGGVTECKFSQKSTEQVVKTYMPQLQWYYLMGAKGVYLKHGSGNVDPFLIHSEVEVEIDPDEHYIACLKNGIKLLDDNWDSVYDRPLKKEMNIVDLLPAQQYCIQQIVDKTSQVKVLNKEIASLKAEIKKKLDDWGDIKTIIGDSYSTSYIEPAIRNTFDKTAFSTEHPDIDLSKYEKQSITDSIVKVNLIK